jgi:predicted nuclease of predicted toxin-antitoxin system
VKLLLDQNLSHKIIGGLAAAFPGSAHVQDFNLERADDATVWKFAKELGFTIVSKDDDFRQRSFLYGHPPKVVWLRLGNCGTKRIAKVLQERAGDLLGFESDPDTAILIIS